MVDFLRFLVGSPLKAMEIEAVLSPGDTTARPDENFSARLSYEDGSLCTLIYTSLGHEGLPKELVELHWDGRSAVLDDFQALSTFGANADRSLHRQDKGHLEALQTFAQAVQSGTPFPIPWEELVETTEACIDLDGEIWGRIS